MVPGLIKKAQQGDRAALARLIDNHRDLAFNVAYSIIRNKEDAQDVTQESFLKVLERIQNFRDEAKFSTWLYRIVYNQSLQFIRQSNRKSYLEEAQILKTRSNGHSDQKEDRFESLTGLIEELDAREKNVLLLYYLGEKTQKEISQISGLTVSNIKVILHRTRKLLRKKIMEHERIG